MRPLTPLTSRATAAAWHCSAVISEQRAAVANNAPEDLDATRMYCGGRPRSGRRSTIYSAATAQACHRALLATQAPRDLRNKVAALLAEKPKPDLDTIAISALMTEAAMKQAPDQPWGALARLDIARHLRRADLLATTRADLQPFAATNDAVRTALADDRIGRAPVWVWLLRVLVLLGLAGTAAHALLHRKRASLSKPAAEASRPLAALVLLLAVLASSTASAGSVGGMPEVTGHEGQMSRYKIDDAHPEAAVLKLAEIEKDPLELGYLCQNLAARAALAEGKHDNAALARYYHAMALAAPTAFAARKECEALEALGDLPGAIVACRETLTRTGVL